MSSDKLPDGVKHLHGAMYLVRFPLLQIPDPEAQAEVTPGAEKQYEFRNPRALTEKGQAVLFDKMKSQEMRESIRDKTLMTPFICRWKGQTIQMVGGERRHRAVSWLINKKELVKDARSFKMNDEMEPEYEYKPADQVYEYVLCQIFHATNDLDALALSYTENDCRVNQGPGHDVAMVIELRQCGATDEKIMGVMSKDEKWLRDTDNIIAGLDPTTLRDVIEDRIERDAALQLLAVKEKYDDIIASKVVVVAQEMAERDYKKRFDKLTKKLTEARDEQEIAEGNVAEAKFQGTGIEDAEGELHESEAKVGRLAKDRAEDKPKVAAANVRAGMRAITAEDAEDEEDDDIEGEEGETKPKKQSRPRPPGSASASPKSTMMKAIKVKELYVEPLEALVKMGGKHPDFGEGVVASPDAIKLAVKLIKGILDNDIECLDTVKLHYKGLSG
jgi:hypothetical protein